MDVPNTGIATEVTLAAKRATTSASNGNGCGVIIGLILLVLTLGWPLFAFHRRWNTYQTVSCSADPDPIGDGCTYDWSTGDYTGTATETTAHTAISATGWIVEAVWLGLIAGGVVFVDVASSVQKKKKAVAVSSGRVEAGGSGGRPTGHDVLDPSPPADSGISGGRSPEQVVRFSALEVASRQLLLRAQRAIREVLTCKVYAENELQQIVTEPTLRRHEWAIAVSLRDITDLRVEQARMRQSRPAESPGPLTQAVLKAQQQALDQKLKAVESLVRALENYARRVKEADQACLDWEAAAELAKLNPRFSDLVAGTAADELHLQEVRDMAEETTTLRDSLQRANKAAEPLLLPDL